MAPPATPYPRRSHPGGDRKVRAIASDPAQYAVAERIPGREPGTQAAAMYPNWVHIVHTSLHGAFGSANAANRIMNKPDYWDIIRRHAADHGQTARATTPKRHITPTPSPSSIGISSSYKTAYARPAPNCPPIGLPEPQQSGYRAPDPARGQFMVGDGTVVPPHVPQEDRRTAHRRSVAHNEVQNGDGAPKFR